MMKLRKSSIYFICLILLFGCDTKVPPNTETKKSRVEVLPYFDEATFTPQWLNRDAEELKNFHQIPEFSLTNQNGENISTSTVDGKIYVTDFFFTTCPGICLKMTKNMKILQEEFLQDDTVLLLSHSVTPETDSVPRLANYAIKQGINSKTWHLLTGDRAEIYNLGRKAYFIEEDLGLEKSEDDFLHTENFVLVDQNRHIRGIYNGLNKNSINQLIADIKTLKLER